VDNAGAGKEKEKNVPGKKYKIIVVFKSCGGLTNREELRSLAGFRAKVFGKEKVELSGLLITLSENTDEKKRNTTKDTRRIPSPQSAKIREKVMS